MDWPNSPKRVTVLLKYKPTVVLPVYQSSENINLHSLMADAALAIKTAEQALHLTMNCVDVEFSFGVYAISVRQLRQRIRDVKSLNA